jgi:hypothetical protein
MTLTYCRAKNKRYLAPKPDSANIPCSRACERETVPALLGMYEYAAIAEVLSVIDERRHITHMASFS